MFLIGIKTAQSRPLGDPRFKNLIGLEKSTFAQSSSATSGLTFYDLELGAKFLYPVLTPLRNMIPRVSGKGGIQASLARDHGDQHHRPAVRRIFGQSRRRARRGDAGLHRHLQGHRR